MAEVVLKLKSEHLHFAQNLAGFANGPSPNRTPWEQGLGSVSSFDLEMYGKGRALCFALDRPLEKCLEENAVLFAGEIPNVGDQAWQGRALGPRGHLRGCWMCWVRWDGYLSMEAWGFW